MMKKTSYINAITDGIFQGFCGTKFVLGLIFSKFVSEMQLETHLVIACLIALFTAIIYFLLI